MSCDHDYRKKARISTMSGRWPHPRAADRWAGSNLRGGARGHTKARWTAAEATDISRLLMDGNRVVDATTDASLPQPIAQRIAVGNSNHVMVASARRTGTATGRPVKKSPISMRLRSGGTRGSRISHRGLPRRRLRPMPASSLAGRRRRLSACPSASGARAAKRKALAARRRKADLGVVRRPRPRTADLREPTQPNAEKSLPRIFNTHPRPIDVGQPQGAGLDAVNIAVQQMVGLPRHFVYAVDVAAVGGAHRPGDIRGGRRSGGFRRARWRSRD